MLRRLVAASVALVGIDVAANELLHEVLHEELLLEEYFVVVQHFEPQLFVRHIVLISGRLELVRGEAKRGENFGVRSVAHSFAMSQAGRVLVRETHHVFAFCSRGQIFVIFEQLGVASS